MDIKITKKDKLIQKTFNIKESQLNNIKRIAKDNEVGTNELLRSVLDSLPKKNDK